MEAPEDRPQGVLQSSWSTYKAIPASIQSALVTVVLIGGYVIVTALFPIPQPGSTTRNLATGKTIDVAITLITADARDLACAGDGSAGGARCAFDSSGKPAAGDGGVLAPYMTVDNVLFLVPNLWKEPALAKRLAADPPGDRERSKRFTANCRMTLAQPLKRFYVRWDPQADWQWTEEAWVGSIAGCKLDG